MKTFIKVTVVGLFSVLLITVYSFLPLSQLTDGLGNSVSLKFDTPDEMINYTFAVNFAERSGLYYVDLVNAFLPESIVFPRWARPVNVQDGSGGFMYPGTFWGLIMLFGGIAKIVGKSVVVPFLTPVFALGCVALMYGFSKQLFNRSTAVWSAFSLACFPVFVYYSSRTMFHTILFLFFWLLGIWLYVKAFLSHPSSRATPHSAEGRDDLVQTRITRLLRRFVPRNDIHVYGYYVSALSFGLALFVRFADATLVLLTIVFLFIWNRADFKRMVIFVCLFVITLVPIGLLNYVSYGSPFDFGLNGGNEIGITSSDHSWVQSVASLILPFGFHPRVMWNVVLNVLLKPYWWFWVLAAAGYWILVKRYWNGHRREVVLFTLYALLFTLYSISLYGSWNFSDSVVANTFPISSSYYRYFLPLFILVIPIVGYAISITTQYVIASTASLRHRGEAWPASPKALRGERSHSAANNEIAPDDGSEQSSSLAMRLIRCLFHALIIGFLMFLSFQYAYLGNEGLFHIRQQVLSYRLIAAEATRATNQEDIILVKRGEDKMVFPDRYHVVNVDYMPTETVERVLKSFKGTVWEIRAGKFVKVK